MDVVTCGECRHENYCEIRATFDYDADWFCKAGERGNACEICAEHRIHDGAVADLVGEYYRFVINHCPGCGRKLVD